MGVTPINSTNAIDTVAFVIVFNRSFIEKEENKLLTLKDTLKDDLPIFSQDMRFETKIKDDKITEQIAKKTGIRLQRVEPNGKIGWMLNVVENQLIISCQAYDRWNRVWTMADKLIQSSLKCLGVESLSVKSFALQYVDRFTQESSSDYSVYDVFNKKNNYLTVQSASAGKLWHVHQGWFEQISAEEKILNILNLGTTETEGKIITTIDHSLHFQFFPEPKPAKRLFNVEKDYKKAFDSLHMKNKDVIKLLLNQKQQKSLMGLS